MIFVLFELRYLEEEPDYTRVAEFSSEEIAVREYNSRVAAGGSWALGKFEKTGFVKYGEK